MSIIMHNITCLHIHSRYGMHIYALILAFHASCKRNLFGMCAGKHGRADKEQEELELPGAGEELEYEDAEYGSCRGLDGAACIIFLLIMNTC